MTVADMLLTASRLRDLLLTGLFPRKRTDTSEIHLQFAEFCGVGISPVNRSGLAVPNQ